MSQSSRSKKVQSLADPAEFEEIVPHVPLLAELSEGTRDAVAQLMLQISKAYQLSAGDILYERGAEDANTGALLVKGSMRVKRKGGKPIFVHAPEILGEMQQLTDVGARTATVVADEDTTVLEFAWHDFVFMAKEQGMLKPEQAAEFQTVLTRRVESRMAELQSED